MIFRFYSVWHFGRTLFLLSLLVPSALLYLLIFLWEYVIGSRKDTARATGPHDRLLGGLLSPDFDDGACLSRYRSMLYRKASRYILSSYLTSKLRKYEELHKKCNPNTLLFEKSLEQLKENHSTDQLECNYVIWTPAGDLSNRMLVLVSTFLYALLTNRVLLVHQDTDMVDLLCEPFPESTWYLPPNFPIQNFSYFEKSYSYMMVNNLINDNPNSPPSALPPFICLHLTFFHDLHKRFFCEDDQEVINKINWVMLKSEKYIVPGLFLIPRYAQEFEKMFPIKETVFHHLSRYLLHPSNSVWGMVMRYHNSYLANAKERIGIQARIKFLDHNVSISDMYKQIVKCTQEKLILPELSPEKSDSSSLVLNGVVPHVVLLSSFYRELFDKLKDLYYLNSTKTGEIISVYQPSHEEDQKSELLLNQKALAEMWLLSFSDVFVTTAGSTFGYMSYSLAGIKPWFLLRSKDHNVSDLPCIEALTIDPCFHSPPDFVCRTGKKTGSGELFRHLRQCEDFEPGVKLFD